MKKKKTSRGSEASQVGEQIQSHSGEWKIAFPKIIKNNL